MNRKRKELEDKFSEVSIVRTENYDMNLSNTFDLIGIQIKALNNASGELLQRREVIQKAAESINEQVAMLVNSTLTHDQISNELNVTRPTINRWRRQGRLPFIKLGRDYYYFKPELVGGYNV
ncbi:helix-turn-helix domain-containing protein [Pedobacter sp.]|uniref:helix-turn-helix domain-containing protein n=1 Tax=Pedobacter sp. TaxID=1411316 RepID=UPI003C43FD37